MGWLPLGTGVSLEEEEEKRRLRWEGFVEKGSFKPGVRERGGSGWKRWSNGWSLSAALRASPPAPLTRTTRQVSASAVVQDKTLPQGTKMCRKL